MNIKKGSTLFLLIFGLTIMLQSQNTELNQQIFGNPPDSIPAIFAKGIISVPDRYEYGLAISPTYDEIFFTVSTPGEGLMVMKKMDNANWSTPKLANLRKDNVWEQEAFFTPDGEKLYFASNVDEISRLWFSSREEDEWAEAKLLDSPVNDTRVFWATFTNNNTMYYSNLAVFKIFKSHLIGDEYAETENAGIQFGMHPSISKDESFVLFNLRGDIYIAFKDYEDAWTDPIKLGGLINTEEFNETCPSLSPDEKYIFFSRYNDSNNKSDIYWVSSDIIEKIKGKVLL